MLYRFSKRKVPKIGLLTTFAAAALALSLQLGTSGPAAAQSICMAHAEVKKQLSTRYAEVPVSLGLASNGTVYEVYSTEDGASWTIVLTMPNGTSCLLANGEAWENVPRAPKVSLSPKA